MGELIEFASNGDKASGYLALPEGGTGPGVIVIQEWWGLVPHITDVADRFAVRGFRRPRTGSLRRQARRPSPTRPARR